MLAGGRGSRIGGEKACVELDGRRLIEYPLAAAMAAGLPAVVVAKRDSALPALSVPIIREPAEPRHPLCGIIAALRGTAAPLVAVGCDMPFLTGELLARLAAPADTAVRLGPADTAVLVERDGAPQPLPVRCLPGQLPWLEEAMARSLSLRAAFALLRPLVVVGEPELQALGDPRRLLFSVNDRDDLQMARRWLALSAPPGPTRPPRG